MRSLKVIIICSLTISVLLLMMPSSCQSQVLKSNASIKAKRKEYITLNVNRDSKVMKVYNKENAYTNKKSTFNAADYTTFKLQDPTSITKAIQSVFSNSKLNELIFNKERLIVNYYLNTSGSLIECNFLISTGTSITALELEQLEEQLKKNVRFNLTMSKKTDEKFITFSKVAKFREFLRN